MQGFVAIENYNNTILWVGQEDYNKAICRFWQLLSFSQKTSFNFGINFDPNEIPKDKTVVFVCRSGGRSARATAHALEHGYTNVYNLKGGMILWNELHLETEV